MARFSLSRRSGGNRRQRQDAAKSRADIRVQITKIRTLLRRRWQLVGVLGALASAALWWLAVSPANAELQQVRSEAVVAERRASNLLKEFQTLQSAEGAADASARFTRAESLDDLLPNSLKNLEMLEVVQSIAEAAGLELGPSSPAPAPASGPSDKLEFYVFNVTVEGEFAQIASFIDGLGKATPLVTVHGATFSYTAANPELNLPTKVELTAELRFWSSGLKTMREIKADLDANSTAGQDATTSTQVGTTTPSTQPAPAPAPQDETQETTPEATIEPAVPADSAPPTTNP